MIVSHSFIQMSATVTTLVAWNKYVNVNKVFDTRKNNGAKLIHCFAVVKSKNKLLFKIIA